MTEQLKIETSKEQVQRVTNFQSRVKGADNTENNFYLKARNQSIMICRIVLD